MAPFAGGEAAGFGIAQIYLLGVNHTAAPGISVIFSAAVRRNPNHDASSRVGYIGQSTAGILRLFGGLLGCGDLGGSLGSPRVYLKTPQRCSILPKSPICCVAFACIPPRSAALMRLASGAFGEYPSIFDFSDTP